MKTLLQINVTLNWGSTGRISEGIAKIAMLHGWDCYIAHGSRYIGETIQHAYQVETKFGEYCHFAKSLLFDAHGLGSELSTKRFIRWIDELKPDVIQLHCIHGYYLNYKLLFEYLNKTSIPVVWALHDCWAFTGHCAYFDSINCNQWKTECTKCALHTDYPKSCNDRCRFNYHLKKHLFTSKSNLTLVPVSNWLGDLVAESFLRKIACRVIHNGTDTSVFKPYQVTAIRSHYHLEGKFVIVGVASPWVERKGLKDFEKLHTLLGDHYQVILVGLDDRQILNIPKGIIGIKRTSNIKELAELYSVADVYVNPTYSDNFPTTNIEALACGTPVITYKTGGSPEAIDEKTGVIVPQGDVNAMADAIRHMREKPLSGMDCRKRAEEMFDRNKQFEKYIRLYNDLTVDNTDNYKTNGE